VRKIHYTLYRENEDFVAQCLDYDVSSFGSTEQEALASLKEAVELYLEDSDETTPLISEVRVGEFVCGIGTDILSLKSTGSRFRSSTAPPRITSVTLPELCLVRVAARSFRPC
jgi:predicted RNase H-like HicB family nuclease